MDLPSGFRFAPADGELIFHCLANKLFDRQLPIHNDLIKEIDFYHHDPNQLPLCEQKCANEKEEYYFTTTEPTVLGNSRGTVHTIRSTQNGYWKQIGDDEMVFHKQQIVGFKKDFIFYWGNPPNGQQTRWILSECRLIPTAFPHGTFDPTLLAKIERIAVCRLRKKRFYEDHCNAGGHESQKYQPKMRWHRSET